MKTSNFARQICPALAAVIIALSAIEPASAQAPSNPVVTQSLAGLDTPVAAGAVNVLTVTASGTQPFTYQWYLNNNLINGATASSYAINIAASNTGSYTVDVINGSGNAFSTPFVISAPITQVPNQMIFEPWNYPNQGVATGKQQPSIEGMTNVYNQATGVGLMWTNVGYPKGDMIVNLANWNQAYVGYPSYDGGMYGAFPYDYVPWYGLADSTYDGPWPGYLSVYQDSDNLPNDFRLPFGPGGSITNGTVYLSFVANIGQGASMTIEGVGSVMGFGFNHGGTTATGIQNVFVDLIRCLSQTDTYQLGVFKATSGATQSALVQGVNGGWSPNILIRDECVFVVLRLTVNSAGGSSGALWVDPDPSTFYASEANVPPPDVPDSYSSGAPDVATPPVTADYVDIVETGNPASRNYALLRVGRTWASVTPPETPTLTVNNQLVSPCTPSTVIFTSTNAGNPVSEGSYSWTFDNGSGPVTLSDTTLADNAVISGSSTDVLTIAGATAAEVGTYTVTGMNYEVLTGNPLSGSASGTLSFLQPPLNIVYTGASLVLSWPTVSASCFSLEQTSTLSPAPITWAAASGGTAGVSGPNTTYTITPPPTHAMYYQLMNTAP